MQKGLTLILAAISVNFISCDGDKTWREINRGIFSDRNIVITPDSLRFSETSSVTLAVSRQPAGNIPYSFTFASSDTSVAAVDASGKVSGVAAGDCDIYVTCDQTGERGICPARIQSNNGAFKSLTFTPDASHMNNLEAISPAFTASTTSYLYAPVKYVYGTLTATMKSAEAHATVSVKLNGKPIGEETGVFSAGITSLNVGSNTLSITVSSEDGLNSSLYTVIIFRAVPVFKTGQTQAVSDGMGYYQDDGYLQKGISWPSTRFTKSGSYVTDNLTGLVWNTSSIATNQTIPLSAIVDSNWRLPTVNEIRTLVNYGSVNSSGWVNGVCGSFFDTTNPGYWTGNQYSALGACPMFLVSGKSPSMAVSSTFRLLSVSIAGSAGIMKTGGSAFMTGFIDGGTEFPAAFTSSRFRDNGNSTYTDCMTGLVWTSSSYGPAAWTTALSTIATNNSTNGTDWRLPNINELATVMKFNGSPVVSDHPGMLANEYWSSTSTVQMTNGASPWITADWSSYAWYINFYSGEINFNDRSNLYSYILVRGSSE